MEQKNKGGRPKNDPRIPPELRKVFAKLSRVCPEAVDIMIEEMVKKKADGSIVKDVKIAEKLIQLYFKAAMEVAALKKDTDDGAQVVEQEAKPAFSLRVVNPSTGNKLEIEQKTA